VITVVRLPNPGDRDPVQRVLTTVARVDLALSDRLHAQTAASAPAARPYCCARRANTVDVVSFADELTQALLRGEEQARIVVRVPLVDLVRPGDAGGTLTLSFDTPTHFRVAGFDHLLPDPHHVFGSLRDRWLALGWPDIPDLAEPLRRVPAWPAVLRFMERPADHGRPQRGFVGVVRYEVRGMRPDTREALWTLARFGEFRGVGRHTTYGFGRVRIHGPGLPWSPETAVPVWETKRPVPTLVPLAGVA
jgi:CRISPR-associated endoribonuclease Cas6